CPARSPPLREQNPGQRYRRQGGSVEGYRANLVQRDFADQKDGPNRLLRSDGDSGQDGKPWNTGIGGGRDNADICRSRSQSSGALRWHGIREIERRTRVSMLEIPHQGGSIKVGNRGNTKAFHAADVQS